MPKYYVDIVRKATYRHTFEVVADSRKSAIEKAESLSEDFDWDAGSGKYYCYGEDHVDRVLEDTEP